MKKNKILYLFPLAALVLSGCSFDDVKSFMSDKIFTPIANLFGGKKESSGGKDGKDSGGDKPVTPSTDSDEDEIVAVEVGSIDAPLSVSEFHALCDENINYDAIPEPDEGKAKWEVDYSHVAYVKAKVTSSTWNDGKTKILYLNMCDSGNSALQLTGMSVMVDKSITDYEVENGAFVGQEIVVRGYPELYKKKKNGSITKTYELVGKSKDDTENPKILKVFGSDKNYGTLENPLTVSEAKALIDAEGSTPKLYVTGTVTSNDAWTTGTTSSGSAYANVGNIWISDGKSSITIFRCENFPTDVEKENIKENQFKGQTIVASGNGLLYTKSGSSTSTYEVTSPTVHSITGEVTPPVVIDDYGTLEAPLTVAEAKALLDQQSPSEQTMYVTGVVSKNEAYSEKYKNTNIWITDPDGTDEFELYGCSLPSGFTPAQPGKDDKALVGKLVVAHGTGKIHNASVYEFDKGCAIDTITEAAPIEVTGVQLSKSSISIEVDGHASLSASVLPAEASQSVEWSISQTGEFISFENGVVTGLAEGTATITATSVADPTKSASCTVTVTAKTKVLSSITIDSTNAKTDYVAGENYSAEGLVVTAHYENAADEDVTAFVSWTFSPEVAAVGHTQVVITANYGNAEDVTQVDVTVVEQKGTIDHPYSVSEAYAVFQGLADGATTAEVYVEGYINSKVKPLVSNGRGQLYLTDGVCATDLYLYNVNNVGGTNDLTAADLPVGGYVKASGVIKNYGGTFEVCWVQDSVDCKLAQAVTAPVITSVGSPVGPEEVSLNGTIAPSNVSVPVVFSGIVEATVEAATVTGDFSSAGEATAYVTIDGWDETLSFQVTVVSGTVLVETEIYKLDGTITATGNAYATPTTLTQGGVSWDVTANTEMNPWRIGGKGLANQNRSVQSNGVVATDDVTKVAVDIGATASGLTLNSVTLNVGKTAGASDVSTETKTSNITNTVVEFERPANTDWSSCYFTVVFNVTRTSTSGNGYVTLSAISFYAMK